MLSRFYFHTGLQRAWDIICLALFQLPRWCQFALANLLQNCKSLSLEGQLPHIWNYHSPCTARNRSPPTFQRCISATLFSHAHQLPALCLVYFKILVILSLDVRSTNICFDSMVSNSCIWDIQSCAISVLVRAGGK